MAIENNPLKQYFRRPAIYIRLPSEGRGYDASVLDMPETGELPVYPMTAIDEITVKTPDALYSGQAVVDVIKSCIPAIKDPWKISSIDLEAILIAVKTATEGNKLEIESECPSCKEISKYDLNLISALQTIKGDSFDEPSMFGELTIKFRPLSYKETNDIAKEQFEIQKLFQQIEAVDSIEEKTSRTRNLVITITKAAMRALAYSIEYIDTPAGKVTSREYIVDYVQNCDKSIFEALKEKSVSLKQDTEIKPVDVKCPACGHDYKQPYTLNFSDFFG